MAGSFIRRRFHLPVSNGCHRKVNNFVLSHPVVMIFFRGANKEQVSRKRLADMKSEHEKQIHALNNKIRELQSKKPRKCSCGGDIQNNTLSITTSSGSSKNYCLSKFSK